jgi:secreted trypsin-like serine protease
MEATVNYVPRRTCYDLLVEAKPSLPSLGFAINNSWICALGPEVGGYYTDVCAGDSGGPMSIIDDLTGRATVVGVVSGGLGCGGTTPAVYTNVEYFTPWIEHWLSVWEDKGLIDG